MLDQFKSYNVCLFVLMPLLPLPSYGFWKQQNNYFSSDEDEDDDYGNHNDIET